MNYEKEEFVPVKEEPEEKFPVFYIGQIIYIGEFEFVIRKITKKDLIIRPKWKRIRELNG